MRLLRLKYLVVILIQLLLSKINAQTPSITSVKPTSGPIGTRVTIKGTNFSAISSNNTVYFGAVKAKIVSGSDTSLIVSSPSGATCQPISVTANGLTAYSSTPFITTFDGAAGQKISAAVFNRKIDFSGSNHSHEAIADIDGDGKPDIISTSGGISIYRNMGTDGIIDTNTFKTHIDSTIDGTNPQLPLISDIDGDGKLDILVTYYDGIAIFKNTSSVGNISFAPKKVIIMPQDPSTSAVADIDGDGKPDIIVASYYWKNKTNYMSIFRNTSTVGNVSFDTAVNFFYPSLPGRDGNFNLAIADIDGDGKLDIALNAFDSINFYKNVSTSGSITNSSLSKRLGIRYNFAGSLSFNDLDGDGKAEMIATSCCGISTILIYKNQAVLGEITDSSFASPVSFKYPPAITYSLSNIPISDIDGDGKPDIVFSADTSRIVILQNTTTKGVIDNTSFASVTNIKMVYGTGSLAVGDLDADGKPEIVFSDGGAIAIIKNIIKPRLQPVITSFSPTKAKAGGIVIIHGNSFTDATSVSFGGTLANSFKILDDSTIIAIVGNGSSGSIKVSTIDRSDSFGSFIFQLPTKPTITSFSPQSGKAGTKVTIYGSSFAGASAVSFGGINASSFSVIGDSVIIAVVDSGASGSVSVTTISGIDSLGGFIFTLPPRPTITSFTPITATIGTKVTIQGSYFTNATSVSFGGTAAKSFTLLNDSTITAIVGSGASGSVSVTTISGVDSLSGFIFHLPPKPTIISFSPTTATIGTLDTIRGNAFKKAISVSFGGIAAKSFKILNDSTITAIVDSCTSGSVSVANAYGVDSLGGFTYVYVPFVYIPDANFKAWVLAKVPHQTSTIGITYAEAAACKIKINIGSRKITNLVGIEAFTSIDSLFCAQNNLTNFDVSKNTALRYLNCSINAITGVDVSKNTALIYLNCSTNKLTSVDVTKNAALVYLHCDGNSLTSVDVSNNRALSYLYCEKNKITSVDVTKNLALTRLECYTNRITSLDVSNNPLLWILRCNENYLPYLDVSKNTALIDMECGTNPLTCIQVADTNYAKATFHKDSTARFSTNCGNLPVTLLSFEANTLNNKISLKWSSVTELNTSYFIIQKSTDGSSFTDKGTVNAIGIGANSYSFTDATPTPGINYYRLKMIDKDGSFSYSKVVSVQLIIDNYQLSITPNPAKDKVNVKGNHIVSVKVIDNLGRVLRNISFRDACNPVLTLTGIPTGFYHLHVQTTDGKVSGVGLVID